MTDPKPLPSRSERPWWRDAVTYQIYIRSFADANGDGKGDVNGIRTRLPYLKQLGVDALWITPWYPSPQIDHGYDVADYMDIEPEYGTLEQAELLIKETHEHGMKLLVDIVPNHSSDKHVWFQEALKSQPGSPARDRYMFRDGKGKDGELPPNNWQAVFGGPAWERVRGIDGKLEQWYLHLFAVEQPDFNWENSEVRTYFEKVLMFWLDRGVDGFRIDVAHGMVKMAGLPDVVAPDPKAEMLAPENRPFWDQDGVHEIYRQWRKILDSYPGDRMAVAEAWVSPASRIARYLRHDELANSFNFDFLSAPWEPVMLKKMIDRSMQALQEVGAPSSWVFNNHDVVRSVDRFDLDLTPGKANTTLERQGDPAKFNIARGTRRARAGALLMLALPGGAYVYQGEELALPEAREIPEDRLTDPRWSLSKHTDRGRDGCRVPLPWRSESEGAFGFSTNSALTPTEAWLPQSSTWGSFAVNLQDKDPDSTLNLYRNALAIRRSEPELGDGQMTWLNAGSLVLAFTRSDDFACYVNFGPAIDLPAGSEILVSSSPIEGNSLPSDTAVWLRLNKK
ncbi:MAG: glycoside hydrolase family 13 protein [Actinobacteria bacterium]|nr:glycoside hydrolase family 13 protein [Actinomycetota bacterium]